MQDSGRPIAFGRVFALSFVCAALVLLVSSQTFAVTYNLHIRAYCDPANPRCGFVSFAAYKERVLDAVQELNLQFETTGISFRPIVHAFEVESHWSEIPVCGQGQLADGQTAKDRRADWKQQVALPDSADGLSLMITDHKDSCCSHLPKDPYFDDPDETVVTRLGLFCRVNSPSAYVDGSALAHEMSHHFCLRHPFTMEDLEQTGAENPPRDPNHDPDSEWGATDTPDDPGEFEPYPSNGTAPMPWLDEDADGSKRDDHQWCDMLNTGATTDDGSPHTNVCVAECYVRSAGGGTQVDPAFSPLPLTASYHDVDCRGPYVQDGVRTDPFTKFQKLEVARCRTLLPERVAWPDACATRGGDRDRDGICDVDENCLTVRNTSQKDVDQDGLGDACDPCPQDPGPPFDDMDDDGVGDACDDDIDGDGCDNDEDQHPYSASVVTGYTYDGDCGFGLEPNQHPESDDSDDDGVDDCKDLDDDGDGICDEGGPEPPDSPGAPGGCVEGPEGLDDCSIDPNPACFPVGAPAECQPNWLVCLGGGCVAEYYLKYVSLINPAEEILIDRFEIHDRTFYFGAVGTRTLSETARAVRGDFAAVAIPEVEGLATASATQELGDPVRMEIWSRTPNQRVAIVTEYSDSDVLNTSAATGRFLGFRPGTNSSGGLSIELGATFDRGIPPLTLFPDRDADGRSDTADNCVDAANFKQVDADADGCGNACDADFDNDGLVTLSDTTFVRDCEGADLTLDDAFAEPPEEVEGGHTTFEPDPAALDLSVRCRAADLNDDLVVDVQDTMLANSMEGSPPGPCLDSFQTTSCNPADCDDGSECTVDSCDASGTCRHLPGGCDDGNACTQDACGITSNQCEYTAVSCNDGNKCTRDSCDPDVGCVLDPVPEEGKQCNDEDVCTTGDACLAGVCTGSPFVCDDGDACTSDECLVVVGGGATCAFDPLPCDDGNPCTVASCDPVSGCLQTPLADGSTCSDGTSCTSGDQCQAGVCSGTPLACDDGSACTVDSCDDSGSFAVCEFEPLSCDDGDACTVDSCLGTPGACAHDPVVLAEPQILFERKTLLTWVMSADASHSNTYRGTIPATGFVRFDHVCFENADFGLNGPSATRDWQTPASGTAYYYLVTEENGCAEGSVGGTRPTVQFCPTPTPQ